MKFSIQANNWLIPIDIFGSVKKGKLNVFSLVPDGITVREANELLNSSECTKQTITTEKMTTTGLETGTKTKPTDITSNNSLSTESGQRTTPIPITTETEQPTLAPCDAVCQSEIQETMYEAFTLGKSCKAEELPSEAVFV